MISCARVGCNRPSLEAVVGLEGSEEKGGILA